LCLVEVYKAFVFFTEHALPEVGDDVGEAEPSEVGREELEHLGRHREEPEVRLESVRHARLLHFHHHVNPAGLEPRAVHLGAREGAP
jgi:hypothetical protein